MGGNWPEAVGDPKDKQSFNVGAKGQAQAAHKMRSMRRLGLSSDRRERP